jgi:hypothetical protein
LAPTAGEVLQDSALTLPLERVRLAADEGDPPVVHDDCLGRGGLVTFHGDDGTAGDDEVRGRDRGGVGRLLAAGGEGERGNDD